MITPQILDVELWKRSGHYDNYRENMYFTEADERAMAVKPMNCPSHCLLYGDGKRSYRDLPIRLADFGRLHRYERSGVTAGLTRVRSFSQDDAHIFCTPDQIEAEVGRVVEMLFRTYDLFGFPERRIYLGTRPEKSIGSDAMWERAEATLARGAARARHRLRAATRRRRVLRPEDRLLHPRCDAARVAARHRPARLLACRSASICTSSNPAGQEERPVMIHRALLGSIERFMAILIEHCAGDFPLWLAPVQVRLVTVTEDQHAYAERVLRRPARRRACARRPICATRSSATRFARRSCRRFPYVLVIGDKEVASETVAPRRRGAGTLAAVTVPELIAKAMAEIRPHAAGGVP